uniref:F-box domain-containing protein n=1 Tax=Steinernema glaseri TaxID=37863 RepID=A0A1I8AEH6_9BILA
MRCYVTICIHICMINSFLILQMDFVPATFVDALCTTLDKEDLKKLQQLRGLWASTVTKYYSKRRRFTVDIKVNDDGTQVGIGFLEDPDDLDAPPLQISYVPCASLTKYDRVRVIVIVNGEMGNLPDEMPLHTFRTKMLPLLTSLSSNYSFDFSDLDGCHKELTESLFSSLRGRVLLCITEYTGEHCIEFIKKRVCAAEIRDMKLCGRWKWPENTNSILKKFIRSSNFDSLDISDTNLTIDVDMVTRFARLVKRYKVTSYAFLQGTPSFTREKIDFLYQRFQIATKDDSKIVWNDLGPAYLIAWFASGGFKLYQDFTSPIR